MTEASFMQPNTIGKCAIPDGIHKDDISSTFAPVPFKSYASQETLQDIRGFEPIHVETPFNAQMSSLALQAIAANDVTCSFMPLYSTKPELMQGIVPKGVTQIAGVGVSFGATTPSQPGASANWNGSIKGAAKPA